MMKETELKPCPFCGGEAVLYHQSSKYTDYDGDYAYCMKCGCRTRLFECFNGTGKTHADTEIEAINAWNRRSDNEMASHVILDDYAEELYKAGFGKQEWISVEDRLPEENGRYLVCIKATHTHFENLITIAILYYSKSDGFNLYSIAETVTHWLPLPEAPKMKGENDGRT